MLTQSGLRPEWWPEAMQFYCSARNFKDSHNGASPYFHRFETHMPFQEYAFGAGVRFLLDAKLSEQNHSFEPKMRLGLFIGYHLSKNGQMSGDALIADVSEIELALNGREVYLHRVRVKEVRRAESWPGLAKVDDGFIF